MNSINEMTEKVIEGINKQIEEGAMVAEMDYYQNRKVKELILWNNGNTMAFDEDNKQVSECQGCILDPKVIENINLLCDENTYFHCEVWGERYNTGIDLKLGEWFKKETING